MPLGAGVQQSINHNPGVVPISLYSCSSPPLTDTDLSCGFAFSNVKDPASVKGLLCQVSLICGQLDGSATFSRYFPNSFFLLADKEINPASVMRPGRIRSVWRVRWQATRWTSIRVHHIQLHMTTRARVEDNAAAVWRPARSPGRRPAERGQLNTIRAVAVGDPYLRISRARG